MGVIILLFCANTLSAQWRCALKNVLGPGHNVELILEFYGEISQAREVQAEIRLKKRGAFNDYLRKTASLSLGEEKWFHIPMVVTPDVYEYEVEVSDPLTNSSQIVVDKEIFLVNASSQIGISDIHLSTTNDQELAFSRPLLPKNLPADTDTLFYFFELSSGRQMVVKTNAYFYENARQAESAQGDILLYASLQKEVEEITIPAGETVVISGEFPVGGLKKGEYLLDITVAAGSQTPIQETAEFIIGSNLEQRIFSNLDDAIRQMVYILPEVSINEMLDSPTKESRKIEFEEAWEDLFREDAQEEMEKYYSRIYEVDDLFANEPPGWQSDRGKIYLQYGAPATIEEVDIDGKPLLRWVYPQWSLMFLFEKQNQRYILVE